MSYVVKDYPTWMSVSLYLLAESYTALEDSAEF